MKGEGKMTETAELLKKSGLKSTRQRIAILDILRAKELPATAEDVYLELRDAGIAVNLSTVYRAMEIMAECRLIRKFGITGEEKAFYEFIGVLHRHFLVCLDCKKIQPVDGCPLGGYEQALERQTHFKISGHKLDIYGYCPDCNAKDTTGA